ncbi:glycosyltransferase, family [Halolamina pelagica]|uniref:Glycosyltransferase, family n=1 Tax=Halolamina pelagica TaxID=699431 RepID=A0A0P7GL21_9EURY|nr:glycosyltransferase [Halolamina pelagica]KPN29185.1 glycosyltransferase, family [Halolamina pelagica]
MGWDAESRHVLFPYPREREVKNYPRAERVVDAAREYLDTPVTLHSVTGVPHAEMPTYLNAADALLLTSNHEGSPNAVKEALACNLPVVATDVGDVRTRLDGLAQAHVGRSDAELVDGLVAVLRSDERPRGRERVREISRQHTGEQLLALYREVVDG